MINEELIEQGQDRSSDYVCIECGVQYLSDRQLRNGGNDTTFFMGECGLCGEEKSITSIRHYNYLSPKE